MLRQRHLVFATILVLVGFAASAQTPPPTERNFPPFLTWKYFTEDPAAFANFGSVGVNFLIVLLTFAAVVVSSVIGICSIKAATRANENLLKTERPYVTGGGDAVKAERSDFKNVDGSETFDLPLTKRVFKVDVGNYGKTPALLTSFDVKSSRSQNCRPRRPTTTASILGSTGLLRARRSTA